MSDDIELQIPDVPASKAARKRPATRKAAKAKPEGKIKVSAPPEKKPVEAPTEAPARISDEPSQEPIPFFIETATSSDAPGNPKKRRRRKKKRGQEQGSHPHAPAPTPDSPPHAVENQTAPVMHAAPRPKLDSDQVARKAWKIFQSEVGEEGLALIDDHDAREISRRCFRLAEIFLEEAARRGR